METKTPTLARTACQVTGLTQRGLAQVLGCSHTQASKYVRGLATPTGSFERDLQQLALDPPEHWSYRLRDEVDQARLDHPDRRKKAS